MFTTETAAATETETDVISTHQTVTIMSDIFQWSYGVLLWEIFSKGELPYHGVKNSDVENYLQKGNRLAQPSLASNEM